MTCKTYTKRENIFHMAYIALLTICGLTAAYSSVFGLLHISCTEDQIAAGFTVFFALLVLSIDFFECRAMGARLYINEDGVGVRCFGRVKVFIKWNEIKEIGIGTIPTPFGSKERAYFCDRKLNEKEKSDLIVLKYHTVHFSHIPQEWYGEMCKKLSVSIPPEVKEKYVS